MLKPCSKCSCSGYYVDYLGYNNISTSAIINNSTLSICKICNGKGWLEEDELILVPRKYIKDEYYENKI